MTDHIKDGGPAFPQLKNSGMAKADENGGFVLDKELSGGMSLRDYFAGQALIGILSGYWSNPELEGLRPEVLAQECNIVADAMLSAREGKQ